MKPLKPEGDELGPPVASDPEVMALFTSEMMAEFRAKADFWMGGTPEGVQDLELELQRATLVIQQIVTKVATGEIPLPGRSGMAIWARAVRDFPITAQRTLDILAQREEATTRKR